MCVAENMTFFQRYIPCYVSVKKYAKRHILQPTCLSWRGHQQHKEKAVHTVCRALAATPTSAVHKTRLRRKMSEGQFRREKKQTPSPSAFAPHAHRPRSSSTTRSQALFFFCATNSRIDHRTPPSPPPLPSPPPSPQLV